MGDALTEILKTHFGHSQFRAPQREIVESILSGKDTLAIMPTGGGKSLCYQLPALASDGVALVVSPLIALMKDQVDALAARGIAAAMINSSQSAEEQRLALARLRMGELKLAYIAPERFRMRSFTRSLEGLKISLFAVDEAHCISQWGHDFRPDYARLGEVVETLGRPPCAAFTATATPDVKADIVAQLKMREPKIFVSGFARRNLSFNIINVNSKAEKELRVRDIIDKYKTGIIYCSTRKSVESLSATLWEDGVRHVIYHGGMTPSQRDEAQEIFISGRENIAVATNAFGMGIDRADIRFVCHYELTGSVEAFYQEAGRAGRDGLPAYCAMLMMYSDKRVQEFFIDGANPEPEYVRAVYATIRSNADEGNECEMTIDDITECAVEKMKMGTVSSSSKRGGYGNKRGGGTGNSMSTSSALTILRKLELVDRYDIAGSRTRGTRLLQPDLKPSQIKLPTEILAEKRRRDEAKLKELITFAYSKECRQEWILHYFGEADSSPCGDCDNCRSGVGASSEPRAVREVLDAAQIEIVRKALSCVARMSRKVAPRTWSPIFGKTMILDCLMGSRNARILQFGYDKISTYAALKNYGRKFVSELLQCLENGGFAEVVQGEYPLFGLTDKGVKMMMGELENVETEFPSGASVENDKISKIGVKTQKNSSEKKRTALKFCQPEDSELFKRLVAMRDKMRRERNVPAYVIFPNTVLLALSNAMPNNAEEAMEIKGIGEAKASSVLPPFLEEIKIYRQGR